MKWSRPFFAPSPSIVTGFAIIVCLLAAPSWSTATEHGQATQTQPATWGSIKAMYRSDGTVVTLTVSPLEQTLDRLKNASSEAEAQEILENAPVSVRDQLMQQSEGLPSFPSEPAWMNPIAQEAISQFSLSATEVLAVQRVVMLSNGMPIDSAEVVVTEDQWYYKSLIDGTFSTEPPSIPLTTQMDIYGSGIAQTPPDYYYCWNDEWVVIFYLPVCFYEIDQGGGRFDGILDAWAPRPNCSPWCNGGVCAGYMCGDAWDGPGCFGWWDYHTCGHRWSKIVGKQVQKRWLHTWQICHNRSNYEIARSVRARIRF